MSVQLKNISKVFAEQVAVDNLSFQVNKGEILGFLGPNGAGKSTTMRMIMGYLKPASGTITVEGLSVEDNPIAYKTNIGYLPENNPLYMDMYVAEYLRFVACLRKLEDVDTKVKDVVDKVGLGRELGKKIGLLSKGYKQRVGLAQAIIHNPPVLILDEPTSGLDPNQIQDIRTLIKELGKDKTIIFSTHIMQEVDAICDRVIILNRGKMLVDDSLANLHSKKDAYIYKVQFGVQIARDRILTIEGVVDATIANDGEWTINADKDISKRLFDFAVANNTHLVKNQREEIKLETIFRELTK